MFGLLSHQPRAWWTDSTEGWPPYRFDVMLNNVVQLCFNMVAIFIFTTRVVLTHAEMGIFPLLYIGAIVVSAVYKCCTKIQQY